jgi:hypothetical protein
VGRTVRVGGLVVDLRADGFTLDDGTATGRIILAGVALDALSLVEPEDALNAIGRVAATEDGPVVVVDEAGRIVFAGDPVAAGANLESAPAGPSAPAPSGSGTPGTVPISGRLAGLDGGPSPLDGGAAGLAMLVVVSAISATATLLRRRRARRRLAARIAARLTTVAGPSPGPVAAPAAERGPSTIRSA